MKHYTIEELWWESKDMISLMIKLISKKLSVQDFKNSYIYLTASPGLLSGCIIQTSPFQQGDLLIFTTIFFFIHWSFSVITVSQWLHHDVMILLCSHFLSSVRLAFQCCCAAIFTTFLFIAQQLSSVIFFLLQSSISHAWQVLHHHSMFAQLSFTHL